MIGVRIRQARLAAGLTLDEVARRMVAGGQPITKAGLSKYEKGKSTPGQTFLVHLGQVLGVKASYFLVKPVTTVEWLAFRKLRKLKKSRQEQVKAFAEGVVEGQLWLQSLLYPDEQPRFPRPRRVQSVEDAESVAQVWRREWELGGQLIESLTAVVEDRGGVVVGYFRDEREFDGLSGWANSVVPVTVVSLTVPDDRRRYNLAHELGHLAMDCEGIEEKEREKLAHRFAAALLVSPETARRELGPHRRRLDMAELGLLKQKYGLSMQAWARRAVDLGIIEQGTYTSFCIEFNRNGWRRVEPYEFKGQENPTRLKRMTLRALAEGLITHERAEQICPGCTTAPAPARPGPSELRKLPREQRQAILSAAAEQMEEEYQSDPALTDFEAFSEEDLDDTDSDAQ